MRQMPRLTEFTPISTQGSSRINRIDVFVCQQLGRLFGEHGFERDIAFGLSGHENARAHSVIKMIPAQTIKTKVISLP